MKYIETPDKRFCIFICRKNIFLTYRKMQAHKE
jgi:hypothetical protein